MALNKELIIDKIEVTEAGHIQVRTATRITEDGTVLSNSYHRHVLAPGDDLTGEDARVTAVATATWTPEVVAAYKVSLAATEAP